MVMRDRRSRGQVGEVIARQLLEDYGYEILERNVRVGRLELDIIAREDEDIVIVEVKTRWSQSYGSPELSITRAKRRNLRQAALIYLEKQGWQDSTWRIDVLAIQMQGNKPLHWEIFQDCIEDES
ncbi:MAG: YraN family protein [Chloroflexi bacterium]|nr:YraN family protein [Chloroflexota bacterium]